MKKILSIALTLCCLISIFPHSADAAEMLLEYDGAVHAYTGSIFDLKVNGKSLDLPLSPIIFNDRALVPVREIFEEVGSLVAYDGNTQSIEISNDDSYVRLKINDNTAYVNGKKKAIPDNVVPKLITKVGGQTKTMVPVRFISETIGMDVDFDDHGVILVNTPDYNTNLVPTPSPTSIQTLAPTAAPTAAPTVVPTPAPTTAPTAAPLPNKGRVTGVSYQASGRSKVIITVYTDSKNISFSEFVLNSPKRIVVDLKGMIMNTSKDQYDIQKNDVQSVRVGETEEHTRIVVDVNSLSSYNVAVKDRNLEITVTTNPPAGTPSTSAAPTQKPAQTSTPKPSASVIPADPNAAAKKTIVLDAGHGGKDGGANHTINGTTYHEKNLTLSIAKKVQAILEKNGYHVVMTRNSDTYPTLTERADLANSLNAALFISIHINSAEAASASGTEVYYSSLNNGTEYGVSGSVLAKNILDGMMKYIDTKNRGVKQANHSVTRRSLMPASLVEVGFISNDAELQKMLNPDFQNKAAQGIAEGIMKTWQNVSIPTNTASINAERQKKISDWENTN